jgi:hypothetical protein
VSMGKIPYFSGTGRHTYMERGGHKMVVPIGDEEHHRELIADNGYVSANQLPLPRLAADRRDPLDPRARWPMLGPAQTVISLTREACHGRFRLRYPNSGYRPARDPALAGAAGGESAGGRSPGRGT